VAKDRDDNPASIGARIFSADQLWPDTAGQARQRQADVSRSEMLLKRDRRAREAEIKRPVAEE
jgi:hypothetical protein